MTSVRRIRADEWRKVRDLRVEAVSDPDASIAFLSTLTEEQARDDAFWQERATGSATSDGAAQFVLIDGTDDHGQWVGTATVLRRAAGSVDHLGRTLETPRSDVVGVYIRPSHRGARGVEALFDAAAAWAATRGDAALHLDVHADNARAQGAYRRAGFEPTGVAFTGPIGPEIEMRREIEARRH